MNRTINFLDYNLEPSFQMVCLGIGSLEHGNQDGQRPKGEGTEGAELLSVLSSQW